MRRIAARLISGYQKYLSPYKGFRCAYHVATGETSCSESVKQIILAQGIFDGWRPIREQFKSCRSFAVMLNSAGGSGGTDDDQNDEDQSAIDEARKEKERKRNRWSFSDCAVVPCGDCSAGAAAEGAGAGCNVLGGGCDACSCTPF